MHKRKLKEKLKRRIMKSAPKNVTSSAGDEDGKTKADSKKFSNLPRVFYKLDKINFPTKKPQPKAVSLLPPPPPNNKTNNPIRSGQKKTEPQSMVIEKSTTGCRKFHEREAIEKLIKYVTPFFCDLELNKAYKRTHNNFKSEVMIEPHESLLLSDNLHVFEKSQRYSFPLNAKEQKSNRHEEPITITDSSETETEEAENGEDMKRKHKIPPPSDHWLEKYKVEWEQNREQRQIQKSTTLFDEVLEGLENLTIDKTYPSKAFEDSPELFELSPSQKHIIANAINGPSNQVLISKFNLNVTRHDLRTLHELNWLNDNVINFYMNLIMERNANDPNLPRVYAMNTFFVPRLMQSGYEGVRRWTRKVDIFENDLIPVPVHVNGLHWCMAIINLKECTIRYYDSLGRPNSHLLTTLKQYLQDESLDKRKECLNIDDYKLECVKGIPQQLNCSDCGVFSCMFAEHVTRNAIISFDQENMPYFRKKMILEILQGELFN